MRSEQFIDSVRGAGWKNINDAQHTNIKKMWEELFPSVASAELEIADLQQQNKELREALVNVMAEYENGSDYLLAFNAARKLLTLSGGG